MSEITETRLPTNAARHVIGGHAVFGAIVFPFRSAVRREDETVFVEVDPTHYPVPVAQIFEVVSRLGVAQLCLGSTLCRARPVAWDAGGNGLVFDLHRHPEAA